MKDIYPNTEKISAKLEGNTAVAGIRNKEEKWTYKEYGTGIVGSQNPHVAEALASIGWKYDVNEHERKAGFIRKEMVLLDGQKDNQQVKNFGKHYNEHKNCFQK